MNKPLSVFISYSHHDEKMCEELIDHLSSMRREGLVSHWHDRKLLPGDDWKDKIDDNLLNAQIILLLVSSKFISSDYCFEIEMEKALEKHSVGEAVVIPIILRPCDWKKSPFGKIQGLPKDGKPVTIWDDHDSAYLNIVEGIRAKINQLIDDHQTQVPSKKLADKETSSPNNRSKNIFTPATEPELVVVTPVDEDDAFNQQYEELIARLEETEKVFRTLPDLISSAIYHEYRNNEFYPDYMDENILRDVRKFEAQGRLLVDIDEGLVTPNFDDPAIEKAMDSIIETGKFIDECYSEVYDRFKQKYKILLDINSTLLWKEFFNARVST